MPQAHQESLTTMLPKEAEIVFKHITFDFPDLIAKNSSYMLKVRSADAPRVGPALQPTDPDQPASFFIGVRGAIPEPAPPLRLHVRRGLLLAAVLPAHEPFPDAEHVEGRWEGVRPSPSRPAQMSLSDITPLSPLSRSLTLPHTHTHTHTRARAHRFITVFPLPSPRNPPPRSSS
jgi:hypothetical protein